jgi:hypothetical protein
MKSKFSSLIIAAVLGLSGVAFSANALAEEGKLVGPITKITMAADGKSATAVLKDKTGAPVTITITDELTLDKFKDKRIVEGDEFRAGFEKEGKNTSKWFKKTAGC